MPQTVHVPGLVLTDHEFALPLHHDQPDGATIEVFAREVAVPDGRDRPFLVYLQGGPGHEAARPTGRPSSPAWLERALEDYRVLMLDQRGTGRSTPYGPPGADATADAAYLTHFRADSIVRDAEAIRVQLGVERWSVLGQSFGGFCALHYLSSAPESLREVYFTGGLPPVDRDIDEVYAATFATMRRLNAQYHQRFPGDRTRLERVLALCEAGEIVRPGGATVSARLFRTIGNQLGMDGGAEMLHYLLELDPRSPAFAHDLVRSLPFGGRNPLYAVVHESCYANGQATRWSAARVQPADYNDGSLLLTGEHLFPWHFAECADLAPYRDIATALADHPWPVLYDVEALRQVEVPCAAAIYANDPFVDRRFSEETAGLLPGMRPWLTDEYLHNGLRGGSRVLDRLIGLARGTL